jgi:hypothetical protein
VVKEHVMSVKLIRLPSKGNLTVGKVYEVLFTSSYANGDTYYTVLDDLGYGADLYYKLVEVV